jgi:hypothetical protein
MLENGSWRIRTEIRGWLIDHFAPSLATQWIGTNPDRARLIASIANPGSDEPTPIARYLLEHFGDDTQVAGPLAGMLIRGSWTGNESDRLLGQITQLRRWTESPSEPAGVKQWAREIIRNFERMRNDALQREAEEDY